jgi:lantibiotic biosynthesis protein
LSIEAHTAIGVANEIGDALTDSVWEYGGEATWMGTHRTADEDSNIIQTSYSAVGPTLYGGTSGIALFLAELFTRTGVHRQAEIAVAAMRHAVARLDAVPRNARFGFFGGQVGVATALVRVGLLTGRPDFVSTARSLLSSLVRDMGDDYLYDVILGAAGGAAALLVLQRQLEIEGLGECALTLGRSMMRGATRTEEGWSWGERATGEEFPRDLTGFAHGASGIGWSLLELYAASGDLRFLEGGREAFRYEARWFSPDRDNWPDFREHDGEFEPAPHAMAWCHGAPGIGLARLRALHATDDPEWQRELQAAIRATSRALTDPDDQVETSFTLCHGQLGLAEFLRDTGDDRARSIADGVALRGVERHGGRPHSWVSGTGRGSSPSLMVGLAGIGYAYLRLADPGVPSVLLCGIGSSCHDRR